MFWTGRNTHETPSTGDSIKQLLKRSIRLPVLLHTAPSLLKQRSPSANRHLDGLPTGTREIGVFDAPTRARKPFHGMMRALARPGETLLSYRRASSRIPHIGGFERSERRRAATAHQPTPAGAHSPPTDVHGGARCTRPWPSRWTRSGPTAPTQRAARSGKTPKRASAPCVSDCPPQEVLGGQHGGSSCPKRPEAGLYLPRNVAELSANSWAQQQRLPAASSSQTLYRRARPLCAAEKQMKHCSLSIPPTTARDAAPLRE